MQGIDYKQWAANSLEEELRQVAEARELSEDRWTGPSAPQQVPDQTADIEKTEEQVSGEDLSIEIAAADLATPDEQPLPPSAPDVAPDVEYAFEAMEATTGDLVASQGVGPENELPDPQATPVEEIVDIPSLAADVHVPQQVASNPEAATPEPVGIDDDGDIKPIDELNYMPDAGWEESQSPPAIDQVPLAVDEPAEVSPAESTIVAPQVSSFPEAATPEFSPTPYEPIKAVPIPGSTESAPEAGFGDPSVVPSHRTEWVSGDVFEGIVDQIETDLQDAAQAENMEDPLEDMHRQIAGQFEALDARTLV